MTKAFRWTAEQVARALDVPAPDGAEDAVYAGVSTDTRSMEAGSLFVALAGERFDAHDFLAGAAEAGATGAVVSRVPDDAPDGLALWVVDDTLHALGRLARHRRRALSGRVVAVAGSNGKTTTKELLRAALEPRLRVHATRGNLNNQVGAPLTLLATPDDAEAVIVEIGTNEPGEIAILGAIVEPDAAIVTGIGEEHLEKLGDLDGVLEEEAAVFAAVRGGPAIVAEEPPELAERARAADGVDRVLVAGFGGGADLRPEGGTEGVRVRRDGSTEWRWRGHDVHVPLPGRHNVRNALLALGLAVEWGVPERDAVRGLAAARSPSMRSEWRRVGRHGVLADCYNSNPASLLAALELLATVPSEGRRVAVVGTMRELGGRAAELHGAAAEALAARAGDGVDLVVATGDFVDAFAPLAERLGDRLVAERDPLEAYAAVAPALRGDETILLKASRGEALERWLERLEADASAATSPSPS